ncbi:caspase family protein [Rhizobium leguminosarum]|uniref:caspase family protein n=1 Tax=Rhizobium leguminosarum TaxID=384 RepID=UPI001C93E776|nr:caspase family protein [Rhizobium leguminosarum]MBY5454180.1 caspase family protein [Rhizobium leguminosarum]
MPRSHAFCIALAWWLLVGASHALGGTCRAPDKVTTPAPSPADLSIPDENGLKLTIYDHSYALLIGESTYKQNPLDNVPEEMNSLKAALESQFFDVSLYLDLDSASLSRVVECFVRKVEADRKARVFVYVSAHGATRSVTFRNVPVKIGYILPIDAPLKTTDPAFLSTALPSSQFLEWAKWLEVKHALFVFDACFSGAIFESKGEKDSDETPEYIYSDSAQSPVRAFLTAGSADQPVPSQSRFLKLLVSAILGQSDEADSNHDGYVTANELISFLKYNAPQNQSPASGTLNDPDFKDGEFLFKLPVKAKPLTVSAKAATTGLAYSPIFVSADANGKIAQRYQVEKLVSTKKGVCNENCSNSNEYAISISVPEQLPPAALLDGLELTCVDGCKQYPELVDGPALSADKRVGSVRFRTNEDSALWRLRATVAIKDEKANEVTVVSATSNEVISVDPNQLSVAATPVPIQADIADKVHKIVHDLQSDDTKTRRDARIALAKVLQDGDGTLVAQLVRGMTTGNYRYQIGIAEALADMKDGWKSTESASKDILLAAKERVNNVTLNTSVDKAIKNFRSSVFYEVGPDGWLTKANQLRPPKMSSGPLPSFDSLQPGQILKADSGVYLRAGPGVAYGTFGVLNTGACVRVISKTTGAKTPGWLDVVSAKCS